MIAVNVVRDILGTTIIVVTHCYARVAVDITTEGAKCASQRRRRVRTTDGARFVCVEIREKKAALYFWGFTHSQLGWEVSRR